MALAFPERSSSRVAVTVRGRSWRGGPGSERRRSWSSRGPSLVMARPRQPREARSRTAQARVRQEVSPGRRPMTFGAAAGLAEGPPAEAGVPDALVVPGGEPQVGGEPFMAGEQAFHRGRAGRGVFRGHLGDPVFDELGEPG